MIVLYLDIKFLYLGNITIQTFPKYYILFSQLDLIFFCHLDSNIHQQDQQSLYLDHCSHILYIVY